ncbi:DUF3445 domain-containing protein [Aestuariicoccus sp. MJ-SS9]|uniref:heme-dependent oxidative N-demethylase family protein n=1 Tax=Aestuariicoccus sp. MJ-SS9 TaxID=3079855 RepID=UPI002914B89F|nr:DUF3445 domain-containing protein [Aestuariicoccus sp. MJ-SS9]MDU8913617.1 DUF3445 domain-containing protein [Aestuariicoccus sp. MJ-SS9]
MILQEHIPDDMTQPRGLPGIAPFDMADWLRVDEAYGVQMAERARLLRERREAVLACDPSAVPAVEELFETVLAHLPAGFVRDGEGVTRPDGVRVALDRDDPLGTLGHLVQEDLCLMEKRGDAHVLTAAELCFPASWRLDEKIMRPLIGIHEPVAEYDAGLARRVQRLFDGIQVGRPLWRFNRLRYDDPTLFQPRSHKTPRPETDRRAGRYLRSERQCLVRLPETRAVVFSIHTYVIDALSEMAEQNGAERTA